MLRDKYYRKNFYCITEQGTIPYKIDRLYIIVLIWFNPLQQWIDSDAYRKGENHTPTKVNDQK